MVCCLHQTAVAGHATPTLFDMDRLHRLGWICGVPHTAADIRVATSRGSAQSG